MEYRIKTEEMPYEQITRVNDLFDSKSYIAENRYFIDCIERGKKPFITAENGVEALKVSLAILESSRTHRVIEL
jgi:predicted dehydrogenase